MKIIDGVDGAVASFVNKEYKRYHPCRATIPAVAGRVLPRSIADLLTVADLPSYNAARMLLEARELYDDCNADVTFDATR